MSKSSNKTLVLTNYNDKLVYFEIILKNPNGDTVIPNYAIVVDGSAYRLHCYNFKECFGIDSKTGIPRITMSEVFDNLDNVQNVRIAPMEESILLVLCETLRKKPFDDDGHARITIGPINCDVHFWKSEQKKISSI